MIEIPVGFGPAPQSLIVCRGILWEDDYELYIKKLLLRIIFTASIKLVSIFLYICDIEHQYNKLFFKLNKYILALLHFDVGVFA